MLVLGLSGSFSHEDTDLVPGLEDFFFHDAAACLVRDGEVIAAVEEERLNRLKKTTKFPVNAIRACLAEAGVEVAAVDRVAYYFKEDFTDAQLARQYLQNSGVPVRYARELITDRLATAFGLRLPDEDLVFVQHHLAHGISSYAHAGMDDALSVVMDGRGEREATTVFDVRGGRFETLHAYPTDRSLGSLYVGATTMLGYKTGDEYKVMGLAPYGDPAVYRDRFAQVYRLEEDGQYQLAVHGLSGAFLADGFRPRRKGAEFTQQHKDFAAALQEATERIALHVLRHWQARTGHRNLCLSGGVAHNCSLNGEILRTGLFDEVYVHPASHDAGAALGAALAVAHDDADPIPTTRVRNANWGPSLGEPSAVTARVRAWDDLVTVEEHEDVTAAAADLLAAGKVLAWARGRSEFGPRALGNRSILADPRPQENQTRINAMIKQRESFRPFAPAVLAERAAEFFELPQTGGAYDFMSFVLGVRPEYRAELGAVTHVDGTARVQVVDRAANEPFWRLIDAFAERTGMPVLLNTSFNNHAEPIVQSVDDAVTTFLTTELDHLVVENLVISRKAGPANLANLVAAPRPAVRVVKRARLTPEGEHVVCHEIGFDTSKGAVRSLSAAAFAVLENADGIATVGKLCEAVGGISSELAGELYLLWQDRFVALVPG